MPQPDSPSPATAHGPNPHASGSIPTAAPAPSPRARAARPSDDVLSDDILSDDVRAAGVRDSVLRTLTLGRTEVVLRGSLDDRPARIAIDHARYGDTRHGDPRAPCLVALGGISATRRVGDWWREQLGPGRPLDTRRYRVLGMDYLADVPAGWSAIAPRDQAQALIAVLDDLGIERIVAIGASYGGAVVLSLAEHWPERLDAALVLSMADRPAPMASALRSVQRRLLRLGREHACEAEAVALARALAVTSYRSEAEFARRFDGPPERHGDTWRWPVEGYLDAQGERFAARFPADAYRALSESLDLHRVQPERLRAPLYLLAVEQDRLVPHADVEALARATGADFVRLSSEYGHDAFLKETVAIGRWLKRCLAERARMPSPPRPRTAPSIAAPSRRTPT